MAEPYLVTSPPGDPGGTRAVVLILHGGRAVSRAEASRFGLANLRMLPFAWVLRRATRGQGVAVWRLRYRYRGWNGSDRDPVRDTEWALSEAHRRHPGVPVVLVGHSMGGRAALWAAGATNVVAVCGLAPWVERGDPIGQLAGRRVLLVHGDRDRITDARQTRLLAARAAGVASRMDMTDIPGTGHAMLARAARWHRLVRDFVLDVLARHPDGRRTMEPWLNG